MNFIAWPLGLSTLILLMVQAVSFHKATVCRQEAWLKSVEMKTRSLLHDANPMEREWHLGCRIHLVRNQDHQSWQRLPNLKSHSFQLELNGDL